MIIGFPIENMLRGIMQNCVHDKINLPWKILFDCPGTIKSICFKTTSNTHKISEISSSFFTILWNSL